MNKLILLLLVCLPVGMVAQKTKKIKNSERNETFYVLKSDKKIRHGEYKKFNFQGKLLISGFYKLGAKDSIWECFTMRGELVSKYDFTNNELIFYNDKTMTLNK